MTLPDGAYVTPEGWVVLGDEAYLPDEVERRERQRKQVNQRKREFRRRRKTDPVARAEYNAYMREYLRRKRYPDGYEVRLIVASLHSFRCTGPTKKLGCVCRKKLVGRRVAP